MKSRMKKAYRELRKTYDNPRDELILSIVDPNHFYRLNYYSGKHTPRNERKLVKDLQEINQILKKYRK